jgi:hypothetical protein
VSHVLAILDRLDQGEFGDGVSVNTLSFLQLLRSHEVGGDLSYASPEQIRGEVMDERSLVFSVGVLIFERLTGRHPFGVTSSARRIARISRGEFGSGVNFFPTVPAGLRSVLMRAMGPFPQERWDTLAEMRDKLERFLQAELTQPKVRLPGTDDDTERVRLPPTASQLALLADADAARGNSRAHTDVEEVVLLTPRRWFERTRIAPVLWAAVGAALATVVFLLIPSDRGDRATPVAASPTEPPTSGVALESSSRPLPAAGARAPGAPRGVAAVPENAALPKKAPAPSTIPAGKPPKAIAPAPAAPAAPVHGAAPSPRVTPASFQPEVAGDFVIEAVRTCYPTQRLAGAGVTTRLGVLFTKEGQAKRLFFGSGENLTPAQRACMQQKLLGIEVGPRRGGLVVEYDVQVSRTSGKATVRK